MSKNVVDACVDFTNSHDVGLILIPSRRQVEWTGGYSNNWTTQSFAHYVRNRANDESVLIMRDHGGPGQGSANDDGLTSFAVDCAHMDLIHIDPWKTALSFSDGCRLTKRLIEHCHGINPEIGYEIGTEEAIFPYGADQLRELVRFLRNSLTAKQFGQIRFAVIQSGTSLKGNTNTGSYDQSRLSDMVAVCAEHGLLSREHNGDYLPSALFQEKFSLGLNAVNIAPEFGQIETQTYLSAMGSDQNLLDSFHEICFNSGKWRKWFDSAKIPSKDEITNACGHYVISHPEFTERVKTRLPANIDEMVQSNLTRKLKELYGITP